MNYRKCRWVAAGLVSIAICGPSTGTAKPKLGKAKPATKPTVPAPGRSSVLQLGRTSHGRLEKGDERFGKGELRPGCYCDEWTIRVSRGNAYEFVVTSTAFRPHLIVADEKEVVLRQQKSNTVDSYKVWRKTGKRIIPGEKIHSILSVDWVDTSQARMSFEASSSGTLRVYCSTGKPDRTGYYTIVVRSMKRSESAGGEPDEQDQRDPVKTAAELQAEIQRLRRQRESCLKSASKAAQDAVAASRAGRGTTAIPLQRIAAQFRQEAVRIQQEISALQQQLLRVGRVRD